MTERTPSQAYALMMFLSNLKAPHVMLFDSQADALNWIELWAKGPGKRQVLRHHYGRDGSVSIHFRDKGLVQIDKNGRVELLKGMTDA